MRLHVKRALAIALLAVVAIAAPACSSSALAGLMANLAQVGRPKVAVVEGTVSTLLTRDADSANGTFSYSSKLLDFRTGSFVSELDVPALRFRRSYSCLDCAQQTLETFLRVQDAGSSSHLDFQTSPAADFDLVSDAPRVGWTELDPSHEVPIEYQSVYLFRVRTGSEIRYAKLKLLESEGKPSETEVKVDLSFTFQPSAGELKFS